MGDLSGYNALPCNPGNAALLHWRMAEQAKGRLGAMSHLLVKGTNKIQAVNLPSAVVADLLNNVNGPSGSYSFSGVRAGVTLFFRRSADFLSPPANSRPFKID